MVPLSVWVVIPAGSVSTLAGILIPAGKSAEEKIYFKM